VDVQYVERQEAPILKTCGDATPFEIEYAASFCVICPNGTMDVDMYCDSDFAVLWGYEEKTDPSCVKSRGGYTIFVGGCPVLWGSKLIDQIALSTMEAEYYAMSYAMK